MASSSDAPPSAAHPLVVIVDDDPAVRSALAFSLELEGFQVCACATGEDLLALELPGHDTCLVIDERLPGITGLATLNRLRSRDVRLPAVLITTNPNANLRAAAASAGAPIVEKPLMGDGLVRSIREALVA
jgi:FixJ family two-component response regulator